MEILGLEFPVQMMWTALIQRHFLEGRLWTRPSFIIHYLGWHASDYAVTQFSSWAIRWNGQSCRVRRLYATTDALPSEIGYHRIARGRPMLPIDEALRQIRKAWPLNVGCLDDLKGRLTGPQPIALVPFVGAGLSMPMGFPSWGDFLKNLAVACGKSSEVAALLAEGQYEEAAETVEDGLSPEIFHQRVTHTFGKRKSEARKLKGAVLTIPDLAAGAVATTNLDRILERVFKEAGSPFEHVAWGSQLDSIRQAIAENKPFLLKIHGDAEERSARVLTKRAYDKHYASGDPEGLRAQLGRAFQGRTLLFVGCSLGQDRTMDVLANVLKEPSGAHHFAIMEKPAADDELFAKQRLLGTRGILPIWYPTGRHGLIQPLLRWIANLQPSARAAEPDLVLERPAQRKTGIVSELDLLIPYQRTTALVGRQLAAQRPDAFLPDLARALTNRGAMLHALGRREDALQATEEAVSIGRQLAAQRPDAFLPDLASSLGSKGAVLRDSGKAAESSASFREGIECLKPSFLRLPDAFRPLMKSLVRDYHRACETAGLDSDLLGDIQPQLADDQAAAVKEFGAASPSLSEPPAAEPSSGLGPWRARPIFISSTFCDMHAERDWLRDRVFPELEERLRGHRHHLEIIDLRQGVETPSLGGQESRELKVLKVCLAEIDRSRPFLIALLGDRYGWTPPQERIEAAAREAGFAGGVTVKSVTALEIEYGILRRHPEQRRRCFFYFRDQLPYGQMPPQTAAEYSDAHAPDPEAPARKAALDALRTRIETDPELKMRMRHYQAGWDAQENRVTGLEAWGRQVLSDLWGDLEPETRAFALAAPPTWQAQERAGLEEFVEHRLRGFTGREPVVRQLLEIALSQGNETLGACVTGGPGAGKSALFAHVYRRLKDERGILVLAHAAGSGPRSASMDDMLRRWIEELAGFLRVKPALPENAPPDDVEKAFTRLLHRAAGECRVVGLVDALNQFEQTARSQYVTWFDARRWPANARILATAIAGTESAALCRQPGVQELKMPPLTPDEARDIGNAVWSRYHRECNPQVLDTVLSRRDPGGAPASSNPLWLTLAMEQLNLLDADDFTRAGEHLLDLLLAEARRLPGEIEDLYAAMLARAEKVYGARWARPFACLLALSRQGWRESDLEGMLPAAAHILFRDGGDAAFHWDPLQFAELRRGFRAQVLQRGALGQWDYFHAQARRAIVRQHLADTETARRLHSAIADYLLGLSEPDPLRLREAMFHLMGAGDGPRAARFYAHVEPPSESTRTLAEALIAKDEGRAAVTLSWTVSLPAESGLDPDTAWRLSVRLQRDLNYAIENRARLALSLRLLQAGHESLAKLAAADPSEAQWQRDLGVSHARLGDVLSAQGDMGSALTAYRDALTVLQRLVAADPSNPDWQRDLNTTHMRLGEVLEKQGDLGGALAAYRDSHAITQRLAADDFNSCQLQEDLSGENSHLGDVLWAQGDLGGALAAYQEGLAIAQELVAFHPSNAQWQRGLSVSYNKLGNVLNAQGDLSGALAAYQEGLGIAQGLAAADPSNAQWQRGLHVSHTSVGDVLSEQRDLGGALAAYQDAIAIARGLAAADPSNTDWQRDLSVSHGRMGNVLKEQGDLGGALAAYREGLAIVQELTAADPSNTMWQRDLSISHDKLGNVLKEQGDLGGALAAYREGLAIVQELTAADPSNAQWQRDVSVSYDRLGDVLKAQGDLGGALAAYQNALAIQQRLATADPSNAQSQRDLSISHGRLGDVLKEQGDLGAALAAWRDALTIQQRLAAADPSNTQGQWDLLFAQANVAVLTAG